MPSLWFTEGRNAGEKTKRILIETGETSLGLEENFGISDLQPVEETSSFSPVSPSVMKADEPSRRENVPSKSDVSKAGWLK
ncbi:hypothetical protein BIW11_06456 [Tropilaelaps mercedesae]|uniref:Uncharacterized protein n=1 Tax=Tropilaelaps mercedesae TaxID=418985 RepID=A0A1V9XY27_9ACAR|nr:hypothetical protein BIW11_06456 [Tropilaelaps mercedesae]